MNGPQSQCVRVEAIVNGPSKSIRSITRQGCPKAVRRLQGSPLFAPSWKAGIIVLRTLPGTVKIPAVVQQTDLPPVFFLKGTHQLVAEPLRHHDRPPPGRSNGINNHMEEDGCLCRSQPHSPVFRFYNSASSSYHCSSCACRARISVSSETSG